MHNLRAALTASIDTIRMGIRLWRTAKKRERRDRTHLPSLK